MTNKLTHPTSPSNTTSTNATSINHTHYYTKIYFVEIDINQFLYIYAAALNQVSGDPESITRMYYQPTTTTTARTNYTTSGTTTLYFLYKTTK